MGLGENLLLSYFQFHVGKIGFFFSRIGNRNKRSNTCLFVVI